MMLDNYVRDFKALIDWIQLQEKLEKTDAQNRWSVLHTHIGDSFYISVPVAVDQ